MSIYVVLPAHNEADRIEATIGALVQFVAADHIIGIADNCTDNTLSIMQRMGIQSVSRSGSGGKSAAVAAGMKAVSKLALTDTDILLLCDADVGESARELSHLCDAITDGSAHAAVGVFPSAGKKAGLGFVVRYSQKVLLNATGQLFKAPLSGQRAILWEYAKKLNGFCSYYGLEVGMSIDLHRIGANIKEIPVNMTHRHTGRNLAGFIHRAKQGYHAFRAAHGVRDISIWD